MQVGDAGHFWKTWLLWRRNSKTKKETCYSAGRHVTVASGADNRSVRPPPPFNPRPINCDATLFVSEVSAVINRYPEYCLVAGERNLARKNAHKPTGFCRFWGFPLTQWSPRATASEGVLSAPLLHALFGGDCYRSLFPSFEETISSYLEGSCEFIEYMLSKRLRTTDKGWYFSSEIPNTGNSSTERGVTHSEHIDVNISFSRIFALFTGLIIYNLGGGGGGYDVAS